MLSVMNVTKTFGRVVAVDDVSFDVRAGEILGFIGPNGSGKSTLFEVISGFYTPEKGVVVFDGKRIDGLKCHQVARLGLSRSCQKTEYFGNFTVLESMLLPLVCHTSMAAAQRRAEAMLRVLRLHDLAQSPTNGISFADQRMLAIGQAMVTSPKMLLLDEPFTGLSSERINLTIDLVLKAQAAGTTTVIIEHRLAPLFGLCDRVVVLGSGSKIAEGTPGEIQHNERVLELYLGRPING